MSFLDKISPVTALAESCANILSVGPGQDYTTLAAAIAASREGDTLLVHAGTYTDDFVALNHRITLQAVGGMVVLQAACEVTAH